jgi:hypothetical protein
MNGGENSANGAGQGEPSRINREETEKATRDNDLTTGHSDPDDGGADNAKSEGGADLKR